MMNMGKSAKAGSKMKATAMKKTAKKMASPRAKKSGTMKYGK